MATLEANPLASWTYGLGEKAGEAPDLPKWSSIKDEHVKPAITAAVAAANAEIDAIEKRLALAESPPSTWAELMDPLERLSEKLSRPWGVVSHLKGVRDSDDLRSAYDECQPEVVTASLKIGQSRPVYDAMVALVENEAAVRALTPAQQRAVECEVRDAKLSGVALDGDEKTRYNEIAKELSALSTEFSNNVLDATKAFEHLCEAKDDVAGLPTSALEQAAQTAKSRGGHENATADEGPWMFTLDAPSYMAVRSHAENRALREKVYAPTWRARPRFFAPFAESAAKSEKKVGDNAPLIERILTLRQEKAKLLGYDNFAEVSMAKKMATLETAESLLEDIRAKAKPAAERELEEIRAFAAERGASEASTGLMQWDVGFWSERLREAKYELKEEDLRPYFQLPAVIDGMFELAGTLFGVRVEPADGEVEVWHPDVRFFKVLDAQTGSPRAYFYLDPYTRPSEKRGGAWMDDVVGRSAAMAAPGASVRLPTAHMVCNGMPPVGDKPSLMTHNEVTTLFHEFGHALQHMLTTEDAGPVAGINQVDWDAVELPSQFMENFCYDKKVLKKIGKHHADGRAASGRPVREAGEEQELRQRHAVSAPVPLRDDRPGAARALRAGRRRRRRVRGGGAASPRRRCSCRRSPRTASCAGSGTSSPAGTRGVLLVPLGGGAERGRVRRVRGGGRAGGRRDPERDGRRVRRHCAGHGRRRRAHGGVQGVPRTRALRRGAAQAQRARRHRSGVMRRV